MLRLPLPLVSFLSGGPVYAIAGTIGLWLMGIAEGVPAFWPANGLLVALILTLGIRQIAWVLAGALTGSLLVQGFIDGGAMGMVITASASNRSCGCSATRAPRTRKASAAARVRFQTVSACPHSSNRAAIPRPICPKPTNPIFMVASLRSRAPGAARACS